MLFATILDAIIIKHPLVCLILRGPKLFDCYFIEYFVLYYNEFNSALLNQIWKELKNTPLVNGQWSVDLLRPNKNKCDSGNILK